MNDFIFVDSDVVISSLISKTGAAYFFTQKPNINKFISNISFSEQLEVVKRLKLDREELEKLIKNSFSIIKLENIDSIKEQYQKYVFDKNDAHIVAGAVEAKARFLISYNLKDFKIEEIKKDFKIIILTPALFLQYLRSK